MKRTVVNKSSNWILAPRVDGLRDRIVNWVQAKEISLKMRVERVPLAAACVTFSLEFSASLGVFWVLLLVIWLVSSARPSASFFALSFAVDILPYHSPPNLVTFLFELFSTKELKVISCMMQIENESCCDEIEREKSPFGVQLNPIPATMDPGLMRQSAEII